MRRTLAFAFLLSVMVSVALAAPSIDAVRVEKRAPKIDGEVLADPAWGAAATASGFVLLRTSDAATQTTEARVLYDDRKLYVGFVCAEDQVDGLVASVTDADGPTYQDDAVELFLAPFANRERYYHFVVNSLGVLRDEIGQDETWDSGAKAAAKVAEGQWSVELSVPLADLALDETVGTTWGLNFCRAEHPHSETSSWAPCESGFHEPAGFGTLTSVNANIAPFVVASMRSRARSATQEITRIRDEAANYPRVPQGRALAGACQGHLATLATTMKELSRSAKRVNIPGAGKKLSEAEADVPSLQSRLIKLSMVELAGRKGYLVCRESTMVKVRPDVPYTGSPTGSVRVSLARNEYEAAQLVVVPVKRPLRKVQVSVTDLTGPRREVLSADQIAINVVGYVDVKRPSGRSPNPAGLYPDPLMGNGPTDIELDRVQSWWVTAYVPNTQFAGVYRGHIIVRPDNAPESKIPFQVRVWDFTLPKTSRLRSSYGVGMGSVWPYYDIAAGPGRPNDWNLGAWVGADMNGVANYFGSMDYTVAFDYDIKKNGKRSVRAKVTKIEKGAVETPRLAWHTEELDLKPNTDYEFSVWYRTAKDDENGPAGYFGPMGGCRWEPTDGVWQQGTYAFNTGDKDGIRVYLKADSVGTVWFDKARLAEKADKPTYNVLPNPDFEKGDETARDRVFDAYMMNSIVHRASPTSLLGPTIQTDGEGNVTMDWARFDEKMAMYIDAGLSAFNVFWCRLPSGWGKVEKVEDEQRIKTSMELLRQTQAHLEEKGWLHLAYIYTIDEPGWASFPQVKEAFELAHKTAPKLKTLLTYGYGASRPIEPGAPRYADLAGYVDIHVPHSDCYEPIFLKKRQQMGDEIWAYVCISAQRPYLNNWGIDYPGMDHRLLFWQFFQEDITGFLYWQTTYWKVNPWEDTLTYPGGNGDGSLVYPGKDGPINSIRFELNRDGTEDYDMLVMMDDAIAALNARGRGINPANVLEFRQLSKSWTEYSENPQMLENQRERIGNRLESFTRALAR